MTFYDFEQITNNMAYFGHNFSDTYWSMGGGKTIGNRRKNNHYEAYHSSYNPIGEHHYEIDTDFDKSGRFDEFTHKYYCGDLVALDLSNKKLDEVKLLENNYIYNGAIVIIKKCIPRKSKYDEPRYEIDIRNYDDGISRIYTVPESMLIKLDSKPEKSKIKIDELTGTVELDTKTFGTVELDTRTFPSFNNFSAPSSILETNEDIFKSSKILEDIDSSISNIINDVSDLKSKHTVLEGDVDEIAKEQEEKYKSLDGRVTSLEATTAKIRKNTTDGYNDIVDVASRSQIEEVNDKIVYVEDKISHIEDKQKTVKNIAVASLLSKLVF